MSYFIDTSTLDRKEVAPGLVIRTFFGDKMLISLVETPPHASPPPHSHPDHEQIGLVLQGEFEMRIGDERQRMKPGDAYVIPPGVEHELIGLEGWALALDAFSPPRDEYK